MEKFIIIHGEDPHNYGNFMMLINCISYLAKENNYDCEFFVRMDTQRDFNRLVEALNNEKIRLRMFTRKEGKFQGKENNKIRFILKKLLVLKSRLLDDLFRIIQLTKFFGVKKIIVLGGDNFSEYYKGWVISTNLLQIKIISKFAKVFLLSQTVGPFYSWRKMFAKYCFKNTHIYCRDNGSVKYLKNDIGLNNNVYSSSDLAFLDLPRQSSKYKLEKGLTKKEYITLVTSGLYEQYCNNLSTYIDTWESLIKKLLNHPKLERQKIVLLPHVIYPEGSRIDDRFIATKIKERLANEEKVITIDDILLPSKARFILGNGLFTITGRMHGAISTLQMKTPAIAFSYSVKYKRVIGDKLGLDELIYESTESVGWGTEKMINEILFKVDYTLNNYSDLTKRLEVKIPELKKQALNSIKDANNSEN